MSPIVGILGYQGCIQPHVALLKKVGIPSLVISRSEQLQEVDRMIIPGGESTTMLKFIEAQGLSPAISAFAKNHPVWGICAGAILCACEVQNPSQKSLNLIDIRATRNYYGSQLQSFTEEVPLEILSGKTMRCLFIRAPLLTPCERTPLRPELRILAKRNDQPVFFAQGTIWACSFHVELGDDPSLHEAFCEVTVRE